MKMKMNQSINVKTLSSIRLWLIRETRRHISCTVCQLLKIILKNHRHFLRSRDSNGNNFELNISILDYLIKTTVVNI